MWVTLPQKRKLWGTYKFLFPLGVDFEKGYDFFKTWIFCGNDQKRYLQKNVYFCPTYGKFPAPTHARECDYIANNLGVVLVQRKIIGSNKYIKLVILRR